MNNQSVGLVKFRPLLSAREIAYCVIALEQLPAVPNVVSLRRRLGLMLAKIRAGLIKPVVVNASLEDASSLNTPPLAERI